MATLAAVLFVVAYNMGEWHEIPDILRLDFADSVGLADHVRADRDGRSDDRGRGGHGVRGAALHLSRVAYDHGLARDAGLHRTRPPSQPAGQDTFPTTCRSSGSMDRSSSARRTSWRRKRADLSRFAPIVVLRLRNMTAIDATGLHALEQLADRLQAIRTDAAAVRRAASAEQVPAACRVRRAHRSREHPAARQRRAAARRQIHASRWHRARSGGGSRTDRGTSPTRPAAGRAERHAISININAFCACRRFSA